MAMLEQKAVDFIEALSSAQPVPGGGGASATVGALASALGMMVINLTVGKKKFADVEDELKERRARLEALRDHLIALTDADAEAFEPLSRAYGLPKNTDAEKAERSRVMEQALLTAAEPPMAIMATVIDVMKELDVLAVKGSKLVVSDVGVGILFAQAALEGASLNVFINTKLMENRELAEALNDKANQLIAEGQALKDKVYQAVLDAM